MQKIEKIKQADTDFSSHQTECKKFGQNNTSIFLNVLVASYNSEEIKLAYKSKYNNKRKNHVIPLIVNDEAEICYYCAVKNLLELYSLGWLRIKKEAIINDDHYFQNALNDALDYQNIEKYPQRISKIKHYN